VCYPVFIYAGFEPEKVFPLRKQSSGLFSGKRA